MSPKSFDGIITESNFAENTKFYYEARELNQLLDPAAILSDQPEDMQLFICGADWWQDPIINTAKQKGWAEERIHVERFTAKVPAAILDKVFDVKIASTGTVYKIPGDKTVTAFLEEQGVKIPTSCEQGMCGLGRGELLRRSSRSMPRLISSTLRRMTECGRHQKRYAKEDWTWAGDYKVTVEELPDGNKRFKNEERAELWLNVSEATTAIDLVLAKCR